MKKYLFYLLGVFLVTVIAFSLLKKDDTAPPRDIPFKTTPVLRGNLLVKVSATGVVEPNFQVEVKSKASGEVLSFPFEEGDTIPKGKLLLQLDKSDEVRNVARARADLASARAKLNKAKTAHLAQETKYRSNVKTAQSEVEEAMANLKDSEEKLQRQRDLFQKKFASRQALDGAETLFKVNQENLVQAKSKLQAARDEIHEIAVKKHEIELARAEVKNKQISLEEARERLEETEIFAPITGVLISKQVQQGQIISSGISTVTGGTALCTLADVSRLFIVADIDETDIGSVQTGQRVNITADAFPGKSFAGTVKRISPQGVVENSITIFKAKIEIQGQGKSILKPMMTANVDIVSEELKNVLYLPREAVKIKDDGKVAAVLENKRPKEIPVTTGVRNPIHVQILSGLEENQQVLVGDWETLWEKYQKGKDNMSTIRKMLFILRSK